MEFIVVLVVIYIGYNFIKGMIEGWQEDKARQNSYTPPRNQSTHTTSQSNTRVQTQPSSSSNTEAKLSREQQRTKLIVEIATITSVIDGSCDPGELRLIRKHIETVTKTDTVDERVFKRKLGTMVEDITKNPHSVTDKEGRLKGLCKALNSVSVKGTKSEVLKLVFRVVNSDGSYDDAEKRIVNLVSNELNMDKAEVLKIQQQFMSVSLLTEEKSENLLGLSDNMTIQEKKTHLREQYKEWSHRVTSNNDKTREKAKEMLELIAQERAKLIA